ELAPDRAGGAGGNGIHQRSQGPAGHGRIPIRHPLCIQHGRRHSLRAGRTLAGARGYSRPLLHHRLSGNVLHRADGRNAGRRLDASTIVLDEQSGTDSRAVVPVLSAHLAWGAEGLTIPPGVTWRATSRISTASTI